MSRPRVVLFDLDDTLFAHREAVDAGIVSYLGELGGAYAGADASGSVALWNSLEEQHYHSYLAGELDFEGQRRARARDFAASLGVELADAEASDWFQSYLAHYRGGWRLHDDALPALDALVEADAAVRFGLITNGELGYQLGKIERVAIGPRLEHIVASGELGVTKPDRRIFEHAVALFGVDPSTAVYVGDRLRTDAIGAAHAGLAGVWINRRGVEPSADERADAAAAGVQRIASLSELPALLARL
ncbi:HAD family hydrolase [Compostimonas suwonensis]|uniref:Putative hydrolase of the HAD superfamily n=1 Tax=Compostimonas suwonensis TaxID=1048394 RepID=A0A2M9BV16_9MICO|nr:HAD family hydrolase [Compostimonas suwonensis]PJJ61796.1 putative hydrolase of the HAD superfamily [Compostimonas suwonensis]